MLIRLTCREQQDSEWLGSDRELTDNGLRRDAAVDVNKSENARDSEGKNCTGVRRVKWSLRECQK